MIRASNHRWNLIVFAAITLAATALRLYRLDAESLYMDEIVTVETFHRDPLGIILGAAIVGQPPLDNFVGAAMYRIGLGGSDWWLRFPSVVLGTASVLMLGFWVRKLYGDVAGWTAALLLAVCPMHAYMSQEVRPYSLMFFLALVVGLGYVRARTLNRTRDWVLLSAAMFAMLMTRWTDPHFIILGVVLHTCCMRIRSAREAGDGAATELQKFRRASLTTFIAYAAYTPFFLVVLYYQKVAIRTHSHDWVGRLAALWNESFSALFAGYSTRTVFAALPGAQWLVALGLILTLSGCVVALLRRRREPSEFSAFWWIYLPFPFAYGLVYALLGNAIPKPQYLFVMAILIFASIALSLDAVRVVFRRTARAQLAFIALLSVFALPMARASWDALIRIDKRDWRGAMGFLREHSRPGDVAVCMGSDTVVPSFRPKAYGKDRYGPEHLKLIPVSTDMPLSAFASESWSESGNSVWMLVYTDRMYTGFDRVVPPPREAGASVHSFNGLFIVELRPGASAIERLMDTIESWYAVLPPDAHFVAPAVLHWRYALADGDLTTANRSFDFARDQCVGPGEAEALAQLAHTVRNEFAPSSHALGMR